MVAERRKQTKGHLACTCPLRKQVRSAGLDNGGDDASGKRVLLSNFVVAPADAEERELDELLQPAHTFNEGKYGRSVCC